MQLHPNAIRVNDSMRQMNWGIVKNGANARNSLLRYFHGSNGNHNPVKIAQVIDLFRSHAERGESVRIARYGPDCYRATHAIFRMYGFDLPDHMRVHEYKVDIAREKSTAVSGK